MKILIPFLLLLIPFGCKAMNDARANREAEEIMSHTPEPTWPIVEKGMADFQVETAMASSNFRQLSKIIHGSSVVTMYGAAGGVSVTITVYEENGIVTDKIVAYN